ncbi:uncharacterized protein LOC128955785 [Oppia nitens]|uniref:uncharacterized protein LOC128955785 n=1 Tax=Oppia nitens TaxID=1686743 RepID=UPI0023D9DB11|nr:uncharacterized protein LOC128955785 [Oppia nitens]
MFWTTILISLSIILVWLCHRFTYWNRHGVKGPNYPEFWSFFEQLNKVLVHEYNRFGRLYGVYSFHHKLLVVNEPDLIRDIVVKDFHILPDHYGMFTGSTNFRNALFFMRGDENWKRIRSVVTPAFTSGKLRTMMTNIDDISDKFIITLSELSKSGKPLDMRKYLGAFAMDVISACAYGIDVDSINNPNHPIVINAKKILSVDSNFSFIISVLMPPLARFLKLEPFNVKAIEFFDNLTKQIVHDRKLASSIQQNLSKNKKSDFIQLMIDNEKNDDEIGSDDNTDEDNKLNEFLNVAEDISKKSQLNLSADELTAQGILFFIAGYDTTSASLSHCIYYLSTNIDCQQKLYEEIEQSISGQQFTYERLNQLKYLNAVINETLRLAPPLLAIQRDCLQDYTLGNTGITVPKGTTVEFHTYTIHRDPEFFAEPNDFKPDRFLEPRHHPYAFIPFGGGPRLCVGMRFALNEMRMCIAKLVHNFEFIPTPDTKLDYFNGSILFTPKQVLMTMLILTIILTITLFIIWYIHRFTYWMRHGVKGTKHPAIRIFFNPWVKILTENFQKYGRIYGVYSLHHKALMVDDPDLIRQILTKDFHKLPDRYAMNMGSSLLHKSLFFIEGNTDWKRIRTIVSPAFTSGKLKAMMASIGHISDRFIAHLSQLAQTEKPIDMRKHIGAFAMDVLCACAYGVNIESINNPNHPIVVNAKKILSVDQNFSFIASVLMPPLARLFKLEPFNIQALNFFNDLTLKIVKERKSINRTPKQLGSGNKKSDFLQLMINNEINDNEFDSDYMSDEDNKINEYIDKEDLTKKPNLKLSPDELTAQGIFFFIAGYDTTTAAISHCIYYLATNMDCQQKLYKELADKYSGKPFTYEELNEFKYLNAVINETLRLAPPLTSVERDCIEDYTLGNTGITIPKGTTVEFHPYIIHRDPEFFDEPNDFKPDRFLEPRHHPYAFIPFGGGPRLCIGMRFALNEMRMCIAKMVLNFEFTPTPDTKIEYFNGQLLLTPKNVMVNIKNR